VAGAARAELILLPGARALLAAHRAALPQRDDLCGAFCGALALRAAALGRHAGEPIDQDAVAIAARSVVSRAVDSAHLPRGESSRRDYRLAVPLIDYAELSGTTAQGLVRALEELSEGTLAAIPYAGPWSEETLAGLLDALAGLERPVSAIANIATRHLWGSHASAEQLLGHLVGGADEGPPPDWDVGHFVCVIGSVRGARGRLCGIADTYPSLGRGGVHVQPAGRLALALRRPGRAAGGMIVAAASDEAPAVRACAAALGLQERAWDNGSVMAGAAGGAAARAEPGA
jgi:hypothetical protein